MPFAIFQGKYVSGYARSNEELCMCVYDSDDNDDDVVPKSVWQQK